MKCCMGCIVSMKMLHGHHSGRLPLRNAGLASVLEALQSSPSFELVLLQEIIRLQDVQIMHQRAAHLESGDGFEIGVSLQVITASSLSPV